MLELFDDPHTPGHAFNSEVDMVECAMWWNMTAADYGACAPSTINLSALPELGYHSQTMRSVESPLALRL